MVPGMSGVQSQTHAYLDGRIGVCFNAPVVRKIDHDFDATRRFVLHFPNSPVIKPSAFGLGCKSTVLSDKLLEYPIYNYDFSALAQYPDGIPVQDAVFGLDETGRVVLIENN